MTTRNKKDQYYRASIERKARIAENRSLIIDTVRAAISAEHPHAFVAERRNNNGPSSVWVFGIEEGEESDVIESATGKLEGRGFSVISIESICAIRLIVA